VTFDRRFSDGVWDDTQKVIFEFDSIVARTFHPKFMRLKE
jgi:hypothetical protein